MSGLSLVGAAAALVVGPIVQWLLRLSGDAPGPLRLVAELPIGWASLVLAVLGLIAGLWVVYQWNKEAASVLVSNESLRIMEPGGDVSVDADQISEIYVDANDLVITDEAAAEIIRSRTDRVLLPSLRQALATFGYPPVGARDPREREYTTWVDHSGDLGAEVDAIFRRRKHALADKHVGVAADARNKLSQYGLAVRDRNGYQQYRRHR